MADVFSTFNSETPLRVAVLGPLDFIKGTQWELNKKSLKKFELYQIKVADLDLENPALKGSDALLFFVEHGVQVPVEHLKKVSSKSGVAVLEYLNPNQMMNLGQTGAWRFVSWEEGRYDRIANALLESIDAKRTQSQGGLLPQQLKAWVKEHSEIPNRLIWTNAPLAWKGSREFVFPTSGAPVVIGSLESSADFKLPLAGKGEWAIIQKNKNDVQFKSLIPKLPVSFYGDPTQLKSGDRIKIFDFLFELSGNAEWHSLKNLLRKHINDFSAGDPQNTGPKTLADTIRELAESGACGELIVKSENKVGYITIQEGYIEEALTGPVSGVKALFRILSWQGVQSTFERYEKSLAMNSSLRLNPLEFQKAYERWKTKVLQLKALWPPYHIKIAPVPSTYINKKTWSTKDFLAFSAVCESHRVFEVLNNCLLVDHDIVESLINLRRERLIQIE